MKYKLFALIKKLYRFFQAKIREEYRNKNIENSNFAVITQISRKYLSED